MIFQFISVLSKSNYKIEYISGESKKIQRERKKNEEILSSSPSSVDRVMSFVL